MDLTLAVHSLSLGLHSWGKEGEREREGGERERRERERRERGRKVGVLDMK